MAHTPHQSIITISEETAGQRADAVVAAYYPAYTRSALRRLFDDNLIAMDDEPVKPGQKMRFGETLQVQDALLRAQPDAIELPILYEDDDVIVCNKPPGILTHSKGALNEEATFASFIQPKISPELTGNRAGIVHRLDRATSGVIIAAKNSESLSWLQKQFSQRRTKKTYVAIVSGTVRPAEAIIDIPLERNPANPKTFKVGQHGKSAQTAYKVLVQTPTHALIELKPVTGRTHQLRVHLQHIKHPIVGDTLYGGETASRLFLHARELEITLPNHTRQVYSAELPRSFNEFMEVDHVGNTPVESPHN